MNAAPAHAPGGTSGARQIASATERRAAMKVKAGGERKIRLLVLTTLYPNAAQPRHGVFVEERLRHLVASGLIEARVVAPVPWFPSRHRGFGAYARFAQVPEREQRHGIDVMHPRYPVIPKIGMSIAPMLMARALLPVVGKLMTDGEDFDVLDAHYFYPDGVAAAKISQALGRPVVITARGTDLNVIPRYRRPRRQIQRAASSAAAVVTVSRGLEDKAIALGIDPGKVHVLRNGVDLQRFMPRKREAIRTRLGVAGPVWLTVGNLIELKGVHIAIAALSQVPDATLLIAGDGPQAAVLHELADRLAVAGRVRFLGTVVQESLCDYYSAADALVHASSREGMPNVVLEALACGTPVVAAPFDGVTELLNAPEAGEVATARNADAIAAAWRRLDARAPRRAATRAYAQQLGWQPVVDAQCALYAQVLAAATGNMRAVAAP